MLVSNTYFRLINTGLCININSMIKLPQFYINKIHSKYIYRQSNILDFTL